MTPQQAPSPLRILIIGRGRMGEAVRLVAEGRGHHVAGVWGRDDFNQQQWPDVDVAIDFTLPGSAVAVMKACREAGIPLVSGTTGWESDWKEVEAATATANHPFLWSPNFSVGVHLFRKAMAHVQQALSDQPFSLSIHEVHHTGKRDAPSGTALSLSDQLREGGADAVSVTASRLPGVPGTHAVRWASPLDRITLEHAALSRDGFASGAVMAAEWLVNHPGPFGKILSMEDVWG